MSKPGALKELLGRPPRPAGRSGREPDRLTRWQGPLQELSDLVFETDAQGRFTFVAPDPALGWTAATLLGQPSELLLLEGGGHGLDPFRALAPIRDGRAWLRARDGGAVCLSFAVVPLLDESGRAAGAGGIGFDVTADERSRAAAAGALRRLELLDLTLWRLRQEVTTANMVAAALAALADAIGADGAAIVRPPALAAERPVTDALRHRAGAFSEAELAAVLALMPQIGARPVTAVADCREFLICPCFTRFRPPEMLGLWRLSGKRGWGAADCDLAGSAGALIRIVLEHEAIQAELFGQSRNDPLTGLFHRDAFLEELARRIDRLEREELPGTLLVVSLDGLQPLNRSGGPELGDAALSTLAALLRKTFRPSDLLGRLGGDEFAAWLDGADDFAAAERAEALRVDGAAALARTGSGDQSGLSVSIAIGTRWPGRGEEIEALMHRVDRVLRELKTTERGLWRVSRPEER